MATGIWAQPVTMVLVPDSRLTTDRLVSGPSLPAGTVEAAGVISGMTTTPGTVSGLAGARPVAGGVPAQTVSSVVTVLAGGQPDMTARWYYTVGGVRYDATPYYIPCGTETLSGTGYAHARAVAFSDGDLLAVAGTVGVEGVVTLSRAAGSDLWTQVTLWTGSGAHDSSPVLARVGASVLCVGLQYRSAGSLQLRCDLSTDEGTSFYWAGTANLVLDTSLGTWSLDALVYDALSHRLLLAVLLDDGAGTLTAYTYSSDDTGATWTLRATDADTQRLALQASDGMVYSAALSDVGALTWRRTDALSLSWTDSVTVDAGTLPGHLAYVRTSDGMHWLYVRHATLEHLLLYASADGVSWGRVAEPAGQSLYPPDDGAAIQVVTEPAAASLTGLVLDSAVYSTGSVWLLGGLSGADVLMALRVGDVSNAARDHHTGTGVPVTGTYYPANVPTAMGWTFTGASGHAVTTDADGRRVWRIDNTAATGYGSALYASDVATAHWIFGQETTGGSVASAAVCLDLWTINGASTARVQVRVDAVGHRLQVHDVNAVADIGTPVSYDAGQPVEVLLAMHQTALGCTVTAWTRAVGVATWSAIVTAQAVSTILGGAGQVRWGKLTATTATVDTLFLRVSSDILASGSLYYNQDARPGLPARTSMDRTPHGFHLRWEGSPLVAGDSWTVASRSDSPPSFTTPRGICPSPARQFVSSPLTGGAQTVRLVYDFGADYVARLSRSLIGLSWANVEGVSSVVLRRWTGAAWSMVLEGYTAILSGAWQRSGYTVYPSSVAASRLYSADELAGLWVYLSDGVDSVVGQVLRSDPGQWTTDGLQAALELDPATVATYAGGGWAALASSGSTMYIFGRDGLVVGTQTANATRYYAVDLSGLYLAPHTPLAAGLISFGAVYPLDRPYREGASVRWMTDQRLPRPVRQVELPFDRLLVPLGTYAAASAQTQMGWSSTGRATVDNVVPTLTGLLGQVGVQHGRRRGVPVSMVLDGVCSGDPSVAFQNFTGASVLHGYVGRSLDVTAGRGFLRPQTYAGDEHGTAITIDEAALWLPVGA